MKTARTPTAPIAAVLAAVIAAGSLASPVMAQDYRDYRGPARYDAAACQAVKHDSQTKGTVFGALVGAVIGSNLAAHGGGRTGGALLGAAAGAAVGGNIGVSSAHNTEACQAAQADAAYGPVRYDGRYAQYQNAQYRDGQYAPRYDRGYDGY
jgi:uncharacterized protein YcfJ